MSDNLCPDAVLQILQQDLDAMEAQFENEPQNQQNGDLALAIQLMRDEILTLHDEILARSTSAAVVSDQQALAAIDNEERIASRDHQYALALNTGNEDPALPPPDDTAAPSEDPNPIDYAIHEIFSHQTVSDPPADNAEQGERDDPNHCGSCLEEFENGLIRAPCGHQYCRECASHLFIFATTDEGLYPPRCCGRELPLMLAPGLLDYDDLLAFCEKAIECSTNRLYCADSTCSAFIPPWKIQDDFGTCPKCGKKTHVPCQFLDHGQTDCPVDETLRDVLQLAQAERWRRCSRCRSMLELQSGCYHMTCRCGQEFCYLCGAIWHTCNCPLYDAANRRLEAEQMARDHLPADAGVDEFRAAFDRAMAELVQFGEEECDHRDGQLWFQQFHGNLECQICHWVAGAYLLECRNCHMRLCYRCRFNRLR